MCLSCSNELMSQTTNHLIKYIGSPPTITITPFIESNGNLTFGDGNLIMGSGSLILPSGKLGIGVSAPSSPLHLRTTSFPAFPNALFRTEFFNVGTPEVYLEGFTNVSGQNYALYQSSTTTGILNSFKDPVVFGNMQINGLGTDQELFLTGTNIDFIKWFSPEIVEISVDGKKMKLDITKLNAVEVN